MKEIKGLIIIPAYNEELVILEVLKKVDKIIKNLKLDVLVINDGSIDKTEKLLISKKIKHLSHPINRGLGAALGTGFEYARVNNHELLVTLDADGQHNPDEISKLIKPIINKKADFVVGSRVHKQGMPIIRKVITYLASLLTFIITGVWTSDSQSGFRAFSKRAIENIFIEVDRMEVSSDFFRQAKEKKLKIVEVHITPIYTEYSLRKGQSLWNSFNILGKLALRKLSR